MPPFVVLDDFDELSCCPVRGRGCDDELCA